MNRFFTDINFFDLDDEQGNEGANMNLKRISGAPGSWLCVRREWGLRRSGRQSRTEASSAKFGTTMGD
jgi:hypothetical protein